MGALTLYAIKSSITLALLYLPYTLLLRRDTFFRLNRAVLLSIVALSLAVPMMDVPLWQHKTILEPQQEALRQVTLPTFVVGGSKSLLQTSPRNGEGFGLGSLPIMGEGWGEGLNLFVLLYIIGMLLCLAWKVAGLVRLVRFIPSGCLWTDECEGATVYCHAGEVPPFSWMHSVVIGEHDGASSPWGRSGGVILQHELAHVRLAHSWDIVLLSLTEALQWFNPTIWMLDASLREVHEYEADDAVLRRGISARDYQHLLIEKAVAGSRYPMANGFNHSLLKNRITMMTRQKSPKWARMKVLYAVPLTLIALGAFASGRIEEKVKPLIRLNKERITENDMKQLDPNKIASMDVLSPQSATEVFGEEGKGGAILIRTEEEKTPIRVKPGTLRLVVDGKEMTEQEVMEAVKGKEIQNVVSMKADGTTEVFVTTSAAEPEDKVTEVVVKKTSAAAPEDKVTEVIVKRTADPDDKVYDKPDVLPEYPGGQSEFWGWLGRELKYPKEALEWGVEGHVHVQFVVEKDGSISHPEVVKTTDKAGSSAVVTAYKAKDESPEELRREHEAQGQKALQDEALRAVRSMPKWKPGTVGGKPVRTKYTLPVMFRLS